MELYGIYPLYYHRAITIMYCRKAKNDQQVLKERIALLLVAALLLRWIE